MKKIILISALALSFIGLSAAGFINTSKGFNIDKKVQSIKNQKGSIVENLENEMDSLLTKHGVNNTLNLVKKIFSENLLSADDCHTVLHVAGHLAYQYHPDDLKMLAGKNADVCIGSFYHGVEAQMTFSSNYKEALISYCGELKKEFPGIKCYHGAGHGLMESNKSLEESLEKCDSLKTGPDNDVTNCYRGIFSEYGSMALGYSGDSGKPVPITVKLDMDNPYKICDSLKEDHQKSCYTQMTKVILHGSDFNDSLKKCLNPDFRELAKSICVEIVSGVTSRAFLSSSDIIQTPPIFNSFPEKLKESYLIGMKESFGGYNNDGVYRDWRKTCEQIGTEADNLNCSMIFNDNEKTGTW